MTTTTQERTRRSVHRFTSTIDPPGIDYPYATGALSEGLRQALRMIENLELVELLEHLRDLEETGALELELERRYSLRFAAEHLRDHHDRLAGVLEDYDEDRETVQRERDEERQREDEAMLGPDTTTDPDVAEMLGAKLEEGDDDAGE